MLPDKIFLETGHCVSQSVQIRSFFWSVFSRIRTEYGEIRSIWIIFTQCILFAKGFYRFYYLSKYIKFCSSNNEQWAMNKMYSFVRLTTFYFTRNYMKITYIYKLVKWNIVNPTWREDFPPCTNRNHFNIKQRWTMHKTGLFTGN